MLRRRWFVFASVVVVAPVLTTCAQLPHGNGIRLIPTDTGTTFQGARVRIECPAGMHGGGVNPHVAEFDDCQRLAIGASHFSSLIGVRALARTTTSDLSPFDQPNGVAVAVVVADIGNVEPVLIHGDGLDVFWLGTEVEGALGGVSGEVWGFVAQADGHVSLSCGGVVGLRKVKPE